MAHRPPLSASQRCRRQCRQEGWIVERLIVRRSPPIDQRLIVYLEQAVYTVDSLKNRYQGKLRKAEYWLTRMIDKFEEDGALRRIAATIVVERESHKGMVIGEGAEIEADIRADAVMISGEVRGKIDVKKTIRIYSTGKVFGDLNTPLFAVEGVQTLR